MEPRIMKCACAVLLILFSSLSLLDCKKDDSSNSPQAPDAGGGETYDIQAKGIPRFVSVDYIQPEKIGRISRFRSGIGHDYCDDFESCRSMKHYFEPKDTVDWASVRIYSPVDGIITLLVDEWAGTKIEIRSKLHPAFFFDIFHVTLANPHKTGDTLLAGELLGHHIGSQTMSDIAIGVNVPQVGPKSTSATGRRLVSYFDVITDLIFTNYQNRGLASRVDAVITKEARDADTLGCTGDTFSGVGTIENWVTLH